MRAARGPIIRIAGRARRWGRGNHPAESHQPRSVFIIEQPIMGSHASAQRLRAPHRMPAWQLEQLR